MCGASAHDTAHDATHDTSVISKQNLLLEFCADPKSRDEMQAYIDVSSRSHFSKYYLKPLLSSGKLEMLFPDKPLFGTIYFPTAPVFDYNLSNNFYALPHRKNCSLRESEQLSDQDSYPKELLYKNSPYNFRLSFLPAFFAENQKSDDSQT